MDAVTAPRHVARWVPKTVTMVADIAAIVAAMGAALELRGLLPGNDPRGAASQHLVLGALSLPVWVAVFVRYRLYTARFLTSRLEEFRRVVHAVGASVLALAVAGFMLQWYVARGWLVLLFVTTIGAVLGEREVVRRAFAALRRQGRFLRRVVMVGGNTEGIDLCDQLMTHPELGYEVVGFIDEHAVVGSYLYNHRPVLGSVDDTLRAVRSARADSVIVATTAVDSAASNWLARQLTERGVHVELSSSLRDISTERLTVRPLGRFPVVYVEPVRRFGWRARAKRAFDVTLSASLLAITAPLCLIVAIALKFDSRGPVLFTQDRIGLHGNGFRIFKFRTMVDNAEEMVSDLRGRNENDVLFKIKNDPRVTRLGRLLRKLSIDEIPQLWNVLRGEMSLVGPRPALPIEVPRWTPEAHQRLRVKPGLTGMWQVQGRSDASFEEYVRLDLYYVDNWSLWTDLAIIAKTVPTVLLRRGAY